MLDDIVFRLPVPLPVTEHERLEEFFNT
jgi:hypothetical protein